MKVKGSRLRFSTPINIGGVPMSNPDGNESVDKQIDAYLSNRRRRALEGAKMAELEHVAEDEKTGAARSRKERQLVEEDKINPVKGEEVSMEGTDKRVEDAAGVAAEAVAAGVDPGHATDLGAGKSRVVVVKPAPKGEDQEGAGGWTVFNGKPIKDPEGDYTFSQALKIAQLENPQTPTGDSKKSLGEELADAKQKLEALGIKVGSPAAAQPKSLREEVTEAAALLESLGLRVGTNEQAPLKEQVAEAKSLLEGLGLSIGIPGESLELIKEKHHHEERMGDIKANREHNEALTNIASEIPERIGHGFAKQFSEEEGSGGGGGGQLETFECPDCHTKVPTPPGISQVTCPQCGGIFQKGKSVGTE